MPVFGGQAKPEIVVCFYRVALRFASSVGARLASDGSQHSNCVTECRHVVGADVIHSLVGGIQLGSQGGRPDARDVTPGKRAEERLTGWRD